MTIFNLRNDREMGWQGSKKLSRVSYKRAARMNSERGLPIRVHTSYVKGVPHKLLILLPLPAGFQS